MQAMETMEAMEAAVAVEEATSFSVWLMTPDAPELPTLADFIRRPAWMDQAVCRGESSHLFFPRNEGVSEEALSFCRIRGCAGAGAEPASANGSGSVGWWVSRSEPGRRYPSTCSPTLAD
jgi:hypothetical protein